MSGPGSFDKIRIRLSIEHDRSAEYLFEVDDTEPAVGRLIPARVSIKTLDGSSIKVSRGDKVWLKLDGLTVPPDVRAVDIFDKTKNGSPLPVCPEN